VLPFGESFSAIVAAFVFPTIVGLLIIAAGARVLAPKYLGAFALGLYLWFFSDTIGDSAYLDANAGFGGGADQVALVLLFAIAILLFFTFDRTVFDRGSSGDRPDLAVPILVALALGIHGLGEGAAFSSTAANTPAVTLLDAFGGLSAALAFVLHKALEPMMVGAVYWAHCRGRATSASALLKDVMALTTVFVLPGIVGAATAYYLSYDVTFVFAFGLGASIYAAARLVGPLYSPSKSRWESTRIALSVLLGFLCLYGAALLHA
jgi:zinc transporter ZupT